MNIPGYNPIFRAVLSDGGAERWRCELKVSILQDEHIHKSWECPLFHREFITNSSPIHWEFIAVRHTSEFRKTNAKGILKAKVRRG
jgi:hypothetical protein